MLQRLSIENYALIDHLDIQFPGDLVIITGETGAGKSVLMGALSLLLGAKADASAIKDKNRNCVVEAEFCDQGREVILRRVVSPAGRSRVFVDDEPVSLDELRELSTRLVDIHSQHQHLLLADRRFQLSALDGFAGLGDMMESYKALYEEYVSKRRELAELTDAIALDEKEREYIEFQFEKLNSARLSAGELQELEQEQTILSSSEQIKEYIARAEQLFEGEENSIESSLREMEGILSRLTSYIPEFEDLRARVESSRIELKDVYEDVAAKGANINYSPKRLEEVDNRLALLYDLMRKHGVDSVEALIELRDKLSQRLSKGLDRSLEKEDLEKKLSSLEKECSEMAMAIHSSRVAASPELSTVLQQKIRSLEMPLANFEVSVRLRDSFAGDGQDDIVFLFNANGGQLQELSKCASGGELSRIMLCLKSLMASYVGMPTMVFDEIDTGVSGSIADKMGELIVEMGRNMQIFAITHLPQVASKGSAHFLVYKESDGGQMPQTKIKEISGEQREREIARMLSGSNLTPEALANARVLLKQTTNI